jgi:hypothetical protein
MGTLWAQTVNDDYYPMGAKTFWGGDFSDSTFHNKTITQVSFTIEGSAASKTIGLYRFDVSSSESGKTLMQSKTFSLTSGTNTLVFDNLSNNQLDATGNYIAIEDDGNLSGYDWRECATTPAGTNPTLVETMIMTGSSWAKKSNEYPTGEVENGGSPTPSGDTLLFPPPVAYI